MLNDRQIIISTGRSRKDINWVKTVLMWSDMLKKLETPFRGTETLNDYLQLPKSKQDDLKDVGGFVGGTLEGNRRKAGSVIGRDIITLDLDNIPNSQTQDTLRKVEALGCAYAIYSTRKHEESKPRLRVLVPINRTCTADEYEPLSRKLASFIGIELCDPSTFEASRLMYWPSCSSDSNYIYTYGDKPFLDVDGMLATYTDWRNISEWPEVPGANQAHTKLASKQMDPLTKAGIIGAFCKTYNVYKAIDSFLEGVYTPCDDMSGRYTFTGGSTVGGAVIYDNGNFLFSHHATDPAGGKLCNAFDLVRLHKFSELDDDSKPETPANKLPSYNAMCEFAVADTYVATILNQERYDKATMEFTGNAILETANWISKLQINKLTGNYAKTTNNILMVLENDPDLKDKMAFDEFANRAIIIGCLPWDKETKKRTWKDNDDKCFRWYLEEAFNIVSPTKTDDALGICMHRRSFNSVKLYLTNLEWDNIKRVDTLLSDYLGAKDSTYTRAVIRKSLVAAVARAMVPGTKYDYMPIFSGPQGIGKSTFLKMLGKEWFSESLQTFEGKEAAELIQGTWINEIGELNGMNRSETNSIKQFLSKTEDIYREPFGKRTNPYPRRCIFFGTTNDSEFLKDNTGNRRFWPIDVGVVPSIKSVFADLENEVDQIWAEAFFYWQIGEKLYLTGAAELESKEQQEAHKESNVKEGLIREFVARRIPFDWEKRALVDKRLYWSGEFEREEASKELNEIRDRDRICAAEIWCECFNSDIKFMRRADSTEINGILSGIKGWKRYEGSLRFGNYGVQKGYIKV